MANKGIVYILTNPSLDGWVKIGSSEKDDIQDRLKELNTPSNIPLSFRPYAIYQVENPKSVEKNIQGLIDDIDGNLRSIETLDNGRIRKREFYKITPERAFGIFKRVAKIREDEKFLNLVQPTDEEDQDEQIEDALRGRKENLSLSAIGIPKDAVLVFVGDEAITCSANPENNKLIYEGKEFSISGLALELLQKYCGWSSKSVAGSKYFKYNGEILKNMQDKR